MPQQNGSHLLIFTVRPMMRATTVSAIQHTTAARRNRCFHWSCVREQNKSLHSTPPKQSSHPHPHPQHIPNHKHIHTNTHTRTRITHRHTHSNTHAPPSERKIKMRIMINSMTHPYITRSNPTNETLCCPFMLKKSSALLHYDLEDFNSFLLLL